MRRARTRSRWAMAAGLACAAGGTPRAQEAPPSGPTPEQLAELHALAESFWNDYVPDAIKEEYQLIGRDELIALFSRLENAGQQEDLSRFAALAPETRAAIETLRASPDFAEYADWLREQLADMETAGEAAKLLPGPRPGPGAPPPRPGQAPPSPGAKPAGAEIPLYDLWLDRVAKRPRPARADELLPILQKAFSAEGVPEALVWVAEVESAFNPKARSPVGARGLFQLMPATAKALGLSLLPFDQRTQPEASARAAAAYLKKLHARFGDWSLALAAYNAGEGRVDRTLKARSAKNFADIAEHLPAETKLYVPKVLATVQLRAGVTPETLSAPGG